MDNNEDQVETIEGPTEQERRRASANKAGQFAGRAAADYLTGGKYEQVRSAPIIGKIAQNEERKLGKVGEAADKLSHGKFGKDAQKLDDSGMIDKAGQALGALGGGNNNSQSPRNNNHNNAKNTNTPSNNNKPHSNNNRKNLTNQIGSNQEEENDTGTGEAAKDSVKPLVIDTVKDVTLKMPLQVKIAIGGILFIILLFAFFLIFVTILIDGDDSSMGMGSYSGLNGYEYYSGACKKVKYGSYLMGIDEYTARVIKKEVPGFPEGSLKAIAVAARTFVIANGEKVGDDEEECYYEADNVAQAYFDGDISQVEDSYTKASEETKGLILLHNGSLAGHYDASCVYTSEQAEQEDNSKNYSDSYYYIKYGSLDAGGINFQSIEKDKIQTLKSSVPSNSLETYINKAEAGTACPNNHGYGMSQNGSAYLEVIEGYDWKQIIDYYLNNEAEIKSIYRGLSYSGNYPIDPDDELYKDLSFFVDDISFQELLSKKGTDINEFNEKLKSSIESAGVGTRAGTVTAAMTLIGSVAEMGYKFNYQWGGKYNSLGARSDWGMQADPNWMEDICQSYVKLYGKHDHCVNDYKWNSFDCSGFANWALKNGMQNASIETIRTGTSGESLNSDYAVCKPGGMLISKGHIVVVVAIDEDSKRYIIAESTGSDFQTGYGGVKLSYKSFGDSAYVCNNLNDLYGD